MRHLYVLGFVALLLLPRTAAADAPPSWREFEESSSNGKFIACVRRLAHESERFRLEVYKAGGKQAPMWSADYLHDGYTGGLLTDDGRAFIYIDQWYSPKRQVVIYREGRTITIPASSFHLAQEQLIPTASHHLWMWRDGRGYKLAGTSYLLVRTVDSRYHLVDLGTGEVRPVGTEEQ